MKKIFKLLSFICLTIIMGTISIRGVYAASATISVVNSASTIVLGKSITTTVTVSSASNLGAWTFGLKYDTTKLRLTSSSFGGTYIADVYKTANQKSAKYTFTFVSIAKGTTNIYIANSQVIGYDEVEMTVVNGTKSLRIMTQAELEATYSKNNNLGSLSVNGTTIDPAFNASTLEYKASLPANTEQAVINAAVADSKSSIEGTGTFSVLDGDNVFNIKVTSESGAEKIYKVTINVLELSPIQVKIGKDTYTVVRKPAALTAPANYIIDTTTIDKTEVPAFTSEVTGFVLVGLKDSKGVVGLYVYDSKNKTYTLYNEISFSKIIFFPLDKAADVRIPSGYKKATITINDIKVDGYKLKASSNYTLIYGMNIETGKNNLYTYDKKENTLQVYYKEEINNANQKKNLYFITTIVFGSLLLVMSTVIIVTVLEHSKKTNKVKKAKDKKDKEDN